MSVALKTHTLPALFAGTDRQPLRLDAGLTPLSALSLTGQSLRFERPVVPAAFLHEPELADERAILPENLRAPLLWLLRSSRRSEHIEAALAHQFDRLRLRPHPFDLPRLAGFVKSHAAQLGVTAQGWACPSDVTTAASTYLDQDLDEGNWTIGRPAARVLFLAALRIHHPARALELLRATWSGEDADTRLRLLETLQPQLHAGNREFIASLQKDRAPKVRALVQRMLYRLDGFKGEHPLLAELVSRITRKTEGLLRRRTVLALEQPANIKEFMLKPWIRGAVEGVSLDELTRALGLSEHELIEGASNDTNLLLALTWMTTTDRRFDLLDVIVEHLPEAWELMRQSGTLGLVGFTQQERDRWAHSLTAPVAKEPPYSMAGWAWLYSAVEAPLPVACFEGVLCSELWQQKLAAEKVPDFPDLLAATCPAALRDRLRTLLNTLEPPLHLQSLALLDILSAMERGATR